MNDISALLSTGIAIIGYFYIIWKAGDWATSLLLKGWVKARKEGARQKAVNDLFDAFDLHELQDGTTLRITTKNNLTIMMYRSSQKME